MGEKSLIQIYRALNFEFNIFKGTCMRDKLIHVLFCFLRGGGTYGKWLALEKK